MKINNSNLPQTKLSFIQCTVERKTLFKLRCLVKFKLCIAWLWRGCKLWITIVITMPQRSEFFDYSPDNAIRFKICTKYFTKLALWHFMIWTSLLKINVEHVSIYLYSKSLHKLLSILNCKLKKWTQDTSTKYDRRPP